MERWISIFHHKKNWLYKVKTDFTHVYIGNYNEKDFKCTCVNVCANISKTQLNEQ